VRYVIHHDGVPVAETSVGSRRDLDLAAWRPLAGFESIRPTLETHWAMLRQDAAWEDPAWQAAVTPGMDLDDRLELRDEGGRRIATTSIMLHLRSGRSSALGAVIIPPRPQYRVAEVIAERALELTTPEGSRAVVVRVARPTLERDDWHGIDVWQGVAEITGLPGEPARVFGCSGSDAVQALLLTLQVVRGELRLAVADGAVITWLGTDDLGFPSVVGVGEPSIGELRWWRTRRRTREAREGGGAAEQP
jgi:hypothetical protein